MADMRLVLGSASPRRAELLRAAGLLFDVDAPAIDEHRHPGEPADAFARRMAIEKAAAVRERRPGRSILTADTVVTVAGEVLGKPADPADAARMLRLLSGRYHQVVTGVCLSGGATGDHGVVHVERTRVWFAEMTETEMAWYVGTGEPADKAGAYAIQGLGSRFVTRIEGCYANVVGLPIAQVYRMCTAAGLLVS